MIETHPSLLKRKIIHIDMDCFYAAVEIRDNSFLKGKPVIIGGSPNSRAVVSTCSYEARKYGIHSAMPCHKAFTLCPKAIFIKPNFQKYKEASHVIRKIFFEYTNLVEPLSLDEAYLDVSHGKSFATQIAKKIRQDIFKQTQLTASAGIAPNKLLAKIASDLNKPNGMSLILPTQVKKFMSHLELKKIPGIGPASEKKLKQNKLYLCKDVWQYEKNTLQYILGEKKANWLFDRSRGIDERPVETSYIRKSLGSEDTFARDLIDIDSIFFHIKMLSNSVCESLKQKNIQGKTITLKVKYFDFKQITRSITLNTHVSCNKFIFNQAKLLLQKTEAGKKPIRLIGVTVSNFISKYEKKPKTLFDF